MGRLPLACLLLALLAPGAAAASFSTQAAPLVLAYPQEGAPAVVATGALELEGRVGGGLLLAEVADARLGPIPRLVMAHQQEGLLAGAAEHRDVTIVLHDGALLASFEGGALSLSLASTYALAVASPTAPVPGSEGPGALLAAEALVADASWSAGSMRLVPVDARVSLLDARGEPLDGWDERRVNEGALPREGEAADVEVVLEASGAFAASLRAQLVGVAVGPAGDLRLTARPSGAERFDATLDALAAAGARTLGPEAALPLGPDSPLRALGGLAPLLDGALLVAPGETGATTEPTEATYAGEPLEVGPMALVRGGDMTLGWSGGEMRIQGSPDVVVSSQGFAVKPAATMGPLPVAAVGLWLLAAAAIIVFVVSRPGGEKAPLALRALGWLAHLVALVVVFAWWDAAFAATFGASFLTEAARGVDTATLPRLGMLLAVELAPWGLAALAFALPVRILVGVLLRYLGQRKGLQGFAKAAGLLALGLLGPVYALWLVNVVIGLAGGALAP